MFSFSSPLALDFRTMSEDDKRYYLERMREAHPDRNAYVVGDQFTFVDNRNPEASTVVTLVLPVSLSRIVIDGSEAWYLLSSLSLIEGEPFSKDFCEELTERWLVMEPDQADKFPERCRAYRVTVDFNQSLDTPMSKFLATILQIPSLPDDFHHLTQGKTTYNLSTESTDSQESLWAMRLVLTLSHDLVKRKSSKYPDQDRFAVLGALLGQGSYSRVYDNPATLRISEAGLFQKTNKPRVGRFTLFADPERGFTKGISDARYEAEELLLQHLRDRFKSKPSFFKKTRIDVSGRREAVRFEKRLPGVDLSQIVRGQIGELATWSLEQRIRVAMAILRALHNQMHARGVIHADVKPHNILVDDWASPTPVVNIIDVNMSHMMHTADGNERRGGTPLYFSPERFQDCRNSTVASDVFAAGITVAQLFGHKQDRCFSPTRESATEYAKNYIFRDLFTGLPPSAMQPEIESHRETIWLILQSMVAPLPQSRAGLLFLADCLEQVLNRLIALNSPGLSRPGPQ